MKENETRRRNKELLFFRKVLNFVLGSEIEIETFQTLENVEHLTIKRKN